MEDQFAKLRKNKKERIAKNELQRLRNIARNMKGKGTVLCQIRMCVKLLFKYPSAVY